MVHVTATSVNSFLRPSLPSCVVNPNKLGLFSDNLNLCPNPGVINKVLDLEADKSYSLRQTDNNDRHYEAYTITFLPVSGIFLLVTPVQQSGNFYWERERD